MYEMEGVGRDGTRHHFEKPWAMTTGAIGFGYEWGGKRANDELKSVVESC